MSLSENPTDIEALDFALGSFDLYEDNEEERKNYLRQIFKQHPKFMGLVRRTEEQLMDEKKHLVEKEKQDKEILLLKLRSGQPDGGTEEVSHGMQQMALTGSGGGGGSEVSRRMEQMALTGSGGGGGSGTGADEPKKVSFQFLYVPVTHWQKLVVKQIPISESTTFLDFRRGVRATFSEEITTKIFRVYKLPHMFTSIEEKVLISSEDDFRACMELFKNPDEFWPELYIWNHDDESPKKLPNAKKDRDCSSAVSISSGHSKICKEKDGYICLCCGHFGPEGLGMKCCHLYEIRAHEALTTVAERKDKLKSLDLVDINELRNLVTMCEKCHTRFDNHQIGIHPGINPVDRRWIITDSLRGKDAPSSTPYRDIHGRAVVFSRNYEPPLEVLEDRFVHFLEKNKNKTAKNAVHYCHFCLESFSGVSGLTDKDKHVELCRVNTLT